MDHNDDLPMISPPSDSTQIELTPQKEVPVNAPEPRRTPTSQVPRTAPAEDPAAKPVGRVAAPSSAALPPTDPRKASEVRPGGSVAPRPAGNPRRAAPPRPR